MPIDLDFSKAGQDWLKTAVIDLPEEDGLSERAFVAWMQNAGITPAQLRRMPIYSKVNRLRYPWLARVAEDE